MYYLWKDKKSTEHKMLIYITDYKEIRKDGKVNVGNYGYVDAELIFSNPIKNNCIAYADKLMQEKK